MPKILVVDDQRNMRTTLAMMLRGAGYEVDEASDGNEGAERAARGAYDVVLTDLRMGGFDGIGVLRSVKEAHATTEVIVMTAYGTIESAVEAMRLGAFDYIQKPFSEQELLVKVERANHSRRLESQVTLLANEFKERYKFDNIAGRSQAVREVLGREARLTASPGTYDQKHVDRIAGVPNCVAYGPGILELAHQPNEYVEIADLVAAAKVMALATLRLLGTA
jgi:two-component system response regulator HydG